MKRMIAFLLTMVLIISLGINCMAENKYTLLVDISFSYGLLSKSRYDVDLYINDEKIDCLTAGKDYKKNVDIGDGFNILKFCYTKDHSVYKEIQLFITENTKITCELSTWNDEDIYIEDYSIRAMPNAGNTGVVEVSPIEDGEIAFRGIPWGSNYTAVSDVLKKDGLRMSERGVTNNVHCLYDLVGWFPKVDLKYKVSKCFQTIYPGIKVAGYGLNEIECFFALIPDSYGDVKNDLNNTVFYAAFYEIDVPNDKYAETYKDLLKKLEDLYGPSFTTYNDKTSDKKGNGHIWKGKKDTYVCLCDVTESGLLVDKRKIRIVYGSTLFEKKLIETDSILSALEQANSTPAPFENKSNDGL